MYTGIESYWEVKGTGVVSTSSEKGSSVRVGRVGRLCGKCWISTRPWRVCRKWIPRGESRVPSWWEEQNEYMWGRNKFEIFMDGLNFFPWISLLIGNSSSLECTCSILHPSFSTRFFLATSWTWHLSSELSVLPSIGQSPEEWKFLSWPWESAFHRVNQPNPYPQSSDHMVLRSSVTEIVGVGWWLRESVVTSERLGFEVLPAIH